MILCAPVPALILPVFQYTSPSSVHARLKQNQLFISRRWRKENNQTSRNPKGGSQGRAALPEHPVYSNTCPVMLHLQQLHTCSTCQLFSGSPTQCQVAHPFTYSTGTHSRRINTNVHRRGNTHEYRNTILWLVNPELPILWTSVSHAIPASFSDGIISYMTLGTTSTRYQQKQ